MDAEPVSPAVTVCVTKQTSYAGKKYRGRMYLPAAYLSEANVNAAGIIDGATYSSLQDQVSGLLADMNTAGLPMYLLHSDATDPTPVNDLLPRLSVRTQRRRQHLS